MAVPSSPADFLSREEMNQAVQTTELLVPSPPEYFTAITASGRIGWSGLGREMPVDLPSNRLRLAFDLGRGFTEAFLAVETLDRGRFRLLQLEMGVLAERLGIPGPLQARSNSLNGFANRGQWAALKTELEATLNEVQTALRHQRDDSLPLMLSLGCWARSTEIAAGAAMASYNRHRAGLLAQRELAMFLRQQLSALPDRRKAEPFVRQSEKTIGYMLELPPGPLSRQESTVLARNLAEWTEYQDR